MLRSLYRILLREYDEIADGYLEDVLDDEWVDVLGDLVEE